MHQYSNNKELALPLAVWLANDTYDHDDTTISATQLLKPIRQLVLTPRIPPIERVQDISELVQSSIGSAIHDSIENSWITNYRRAMTELGYSQNLIDKIKLNPTAEQLESNPNLVPVYLEQRLKRKFNKTTISGKFDFLPAGEVNDFKSTTVFGYVNSLKNEDYSLQGSVYRWLDPELITSDFINIHFIFLDWKPYETYKDNYPPFRIHSQRYPLLSLSETEVFMDDKLTSYYRYKDAPEDQIPLCTDKELWRSETVFKYYKNPNNTSGRSTKNFTNQMDANTRLQKDNYVGVVKEIPGQVKACHYCSAFTLCTQKDDLIAQGQLILD